VFYSFMSSVSGFNCKPSLYVTLLKLSCKHLIIYAVQISVLEKCCPCKVLCSYELYAQNTIP
jgi:hypothetical protein